MVLSGQQWALKGITFNGATTGILATAFELVCVHCSFSNGAVGIEASGVSGSLTVIDSTGYNLGTLVSSSNAGGSAENSIVLENVQITNGNTVTLNSTILPLGSVTDTWVHGNTVSDDAGALLDCVNQKPLTEFTAVYIRQRPSESIWNNRQHPASFSAAERQWRLFHDGTPYLLPV
jgi:hypothetical protein